MINIFILSIFIGYFAIWHVTPTLHSPLMSLTNAISGIVILGALQILHNLPSFISPLWIYLSLFFASLNIFGGFFITKRMLNMFKPRKKDD